MDTQWIIFLVCSVVTVANVAHAVFMKRFTLFVYLRAPWGLALLGSSLCLFAAGSLAGRSLALLLFSIGLSTWFVLMQLLAIRERSRAADGAGSGGTAT
jgi:hypothetical protein